jgi:hypothetical protein
MVDQQILAVQCVGSLLKLQKHTTIWCCVTIWMLQEQQPERPKASLVLIYLHGEEQGGITWWSEQQQQQPQPERPKASLVLMYLHGEELGLL